MADDLSTILLAGQGGFTLTPEKLELMGKEAASLLIEKRVPLEDTVVKLASSYPDMNAEQVKRVVEFANTATYLAFHDKNKTAGSEHSYPQFQLADPQSVMKKLSGVAEVNIASTSDLDYLLAPAKKKIASAQAEEELERMFLGDGKSKTASIDFSPETVETVLLNTKHDLVDLKEHLAAAQEHFRGMIEEADDSYYDAMKRHLLDGGSFADVMRGAQESGLKTEKLAEAMRPYIERLVTEEVASVEELMKQSQEFSKVAHRVVDESHPFVAGFASIQTLEGELQKVALALTDVEAQLTRVQKSINEDLLRVR